MVLIPVVDLVKCHRAYNYVYHECHQKRKRFSTRIYNFESILNIFANSVINFQQFNLRFIDLDLLRSFANCLKKFICVGYNYYTIDCLMTCRVETNQGFRSFKSSAQFRGTISYHSRGAVDQYIADQDMDYP